MLSGELGSTPGLEGPETSHCVNLNLRIICPTGDGVSFKFLFRKGLEIFGWKAEAI